VEGTSSMSISPDGRENHEIVCEYFLGRDYGKCKFISVVPCSMGETFEIKVNPRNLGETTMTPPAAWKAWVGIGLMIGWLLFGELIQSLFRRLSH
jgi:hypothetical protein